MTASNDAVTAFLALYGYRPEGVWSAPGRANLIGEHTDYNDGLALPFAINFRTYAAVSPREDREVRVWSREENSDPVIWSLDSDPPTQYGWASYPLGVVSLMANNNERGLDIAIASDVPVGAGLSSSAALECAIAVAVRELWGTSHTATDLAAIGARAENDIVGAPTGTMDQLASMLGQQHHAIAIDFHTQHSMHVPLAVADHGLSLVIVDSGQRHDHATGGYGERRAVCDTIPGALGISSLRDVSEDTLTEALAELDEEQGRLLTHVVTENRRVHDAIDALTDGDYAAVGGLLTQSHRSLRDDFRVSTEYIDALVDALTGAGAIGARLCGGGFGGSVIALIPDEKLSAAKDYIASMPPAPGAQEAPTLRVVTPEHGAGKN